MKSKHLGLETRVVHVLEAFRRLLERKYLRVRDMPLGLPTMFLPMVVLKKNLQLPSRPPLARPNLTPKVSQRKENLADNGTRHAYLGWAQVIHSTGLIGRTGCCALAAQNMINTSNKGIDVGGGGIPRCHPPHLMAINVPVPKK